MNDTKNINDSHEIHSIASIPVLEKAPSLPATSPMTDKQVEKPYSIYTRSEKWFIVSVVSFGGLFSPLTANIYFPAIPQIASAFHKTTELINLTVTVYMVVQGISPMFWGTLSDRIGRRPIFVLCLLILSLSCVGLALVPTSDYWLLMLLRCIQAAGSASTIALGAGVIGDISVAEERGGFFGIYSIGPMIGPAIGPVIGGGLAQSLGWRAIFWFLCISSAACFLFVLMCLPETLRAIVGDGSITPSSIYRPLIKVVGRNRTDTSTERPPYKKLVSPFRLLTYVDIIILLIFNGIIYSVFYGVTATISTLFEEAYPFLSETDIGLCFLAIGGGMIIGSCFTGKFLDHDYQTIKQEMIRSLQSDPEKFPSGMTSADVTKEEYFPIERARLRTMPYYLAVFVACTIGYGWCLHQKVSIAGPLVLQIVIGYVSLSVMNTTQTLIIDLVPSQGSSVTACNNIVRCSLGAALVSVIDIIIRKLGTGWTYVLLAGICVLTAPLLFLEMRIGPGCRAKRRVQSQRDRDAGA